MLKLIKSSYFLKIIVENLDVKKKLKFFMVNKSLLKRLNISIKDFAKIYSDKLIIKHDSSHLNGKFIDDNVLEYLDINKIYINYGILNLSDNSIVNIEPLKRIEFDSYIDYIYLSNNNISNISDLEKLNLKHLSRIILSMNKIEDINFL